MAFDVQGARKAGYSDAEIADHLSQEDGFDAAGARKAGYSDAEIVSHLAGEPSTASPAAAPKPSTPSRQKAVAAAKARVANTPNQVRMVTQGASLGFSDELDATGAALETGANNFIRRMTGKPSVGYGMGDAFHAVMDVENDADRKFVADHPVQGIGLQIAGGLAAPGMSAAGNFVSRGATAGARVARGIGVGAMTGAAAGGGTSRGGVKERAVGAGIGMVTGAATGGVLTGASEGARVAGRAVNNVTGQRFVSPAQSAAARLRDALAADGVDEATINRAVGEYADVGANAPTLLDVAGQNTKRLLRYAGSRPGEASNIAQDYRNTTAEALPDTSIARARGLTPTDNRSAAAIRSSAEADIAAASAGAGPEAGSGGAQVHAALNQEYDSARTAVDNAYAAAREAAPEAAHLPATELPQLSAGLRESVRDYHPQDVPSVTRVLDGIDRLSTPTLRDLYDARQRLSILRSSNDGIQSGAASRAVRAIDSAIQDAVDRGAVTGDPEVVGLWRNAIGLRRDLGRQFEGDDLIQSLTQREVHGQGRTNAVAPEDASNRILGRTGLAQRPDLVRDLTRVRDTLGADSPQWSALRDEAAHRVLGRDAGTENFGNAWEQFRTQNPQLAALIESPALNARLAEARGRIGAAVGQRTGVETGARLLAMGPEEFTAATSGMTPEARQAAQVGARQAITDALGQRANASPILRQIAFAPSARRNLTALFGEDEAGRFIAAAKLNLKQVQNANFVAPDTGSQTFGRGDDAKGIMSMVHAVRAPVQAILEKVANGLTITDAEAEALVRAGLMKADDASALIAPRMGRMPPPGRLAGRAVGAVQAPIGMTTRGGSVTAEVVGHPEYGVGVSTR